MTAKILDGNALSAKLRESLRHRAAELTAQGCQPGLAVILVGENPASQVYVRNKIKACEAVGVHSEKYEFPADTPPEKVLKKIAALNADPKIHGILVQLPLPPQFDEDEVLEAISAEKDVDGFHAENVGLLAQGNPRFISCTPYGVMEMLSARGHLACAARGGGGRPQQHRRKPMTLLLNRRQRTVTTVCHSRTTDLAFHTRRADILVAAAGKAKMITGDMIKPGATVIDVGINRLPDGKLCGDVDFASAREVAGLITPVPGGVGPMTITMLLANTIESADRAAGK